jgi:hypothetical protein
VVELAGVVVVFGGVLELGEVGLGQLVVLDGPTALDQLADGLQHGPGLDHVLDLDVLELQVQLVVVFPLLLEVRVDGNQVQLEGQVFLLLDGLQHFLLGVDAVLAQVLEATRAARILVVLLLAHQQLL